MGSTMLWVRKATSSDVCCKFIELRAARWPSCLCNADELKFFLNGSANIREMRAFQLDGLAGHVDEKIIITTWSAHVCVFIFRLSKFRVKFSKKNNEKTRHN